MMKIYISIATYNEKGNIERLISEIFGLQIPDLTIIVIDDNSPDGTAKTVSRLQNKFPNLILIKRIKKLGYGSAHITAFKRALAAGAKIVITMDADFSHDPQTIPVLIRAIQKGADVAVGSRKVPGGEIIGWNRWRKFCSTGAMLTSRFLLGIKTKDLTSGFRAYRDQTLTTIGLNQIKSNGYSFLEESIYLVEKHQLKIAEVPIVFSDRKLGRSKLSRLEIVKFFMTILRIKLQNLF